MKSLEQFINDTRGQLVGVSWNSDLDGECVSLIQRYINECFGIEMKPRGHAKDFGDNLVREGSFHVVDSLECGDLIVWGRDVAGGYGHISIWIGDGKVYEQNRSFCKTANINDRIGVSAYEYYRSNTALTQDIEAPTNPNNDFGEEIFETGVFTANETINVRSEPNRSSEVVAQYNAGESVTYDRYYKNDGHVWISYIASSGNRRYMAIRTYENGVYGEKWGIIE